MRGLRRRYGAWFYPVATVLFLIGAWELAIRVGNVPPYLLPRAEQVVASLADGLVDGRLLVEGVATLRSAMIGYLLGSSIAVAVGVAIGESRWLERFFLPIVTGFQAIPKVALAPLVFIWLGFGSPGVIALVALACFFPVFTSTMVGLRSADPMLIDLYRAHSATRWRILMDVRVPAATVFVFSGFQVAIVFAFIATVVMEFVAATQGLGYVIQDSANTLDLPISFAAVLVLAVLGITGTALVRRVRRAVVFWERGLPARSAEATL